MMMSINGAGGGGGISVQPQSQQQQQQSQGPVARWLETIVSTNMCKQYVEVFKRYGYDTLSDVCKLESNMLAQMGVTNSDNEKIMENVSVLRQTLKGTSSRFVCVKLGGRGRLQGISGELN